MSNPPTPPPNAFDMEPVTRADFARFRHYIGKDVQGLRHRIDAFEKVLERLAVYLEQKAEKTTSV